MDFDVFLQQPPQALPARPQALFVGVLERYKNVDGLADAWRLAAPRVADAQLRLVGRGTLRPVVEQLLRDVPGQTSWDERLSQPDVSRALDESTVLVLPSRSEGMGRVIVEAFCRGRGVVASRVGGIPDLVDDDRNGLLVQRGDSNALADALVRVLSDRQLAERLAAAAHASADLWTSSAEEFAARIRALVEQIAGLR
jgi:glycosyltransferase involved in cell wall biosynthesis